MIADRREIRLLDGCHEGKERYEFILGIW